jgi:hypothetical protein
VSGSETQPKSGEVCLAVTSGMLLGHIVSKDRIAMDPDKVKAILEAPGHTTPRLLIDSWGKFGGIIGSFAIC